MKTRKKMFLMIVFAFLAQLSFGQQKTVTGVVKDETGLLPGVTVTNKSDRKSSATDFDGKYAIKADEGDILTFSFVGYSTKSIAVSQSNKIDVVLTNDAKVMEEVVVAAFGIQRDKKSLGYSNSKISSTELTAAKSINVSNMIAGKVPGIRVSGTGGAFTGSSIIIRGFTTFTGSNQPLYVIDGVPIDNSGGGTQLQRGSSQSNRAIDINPEDIEDIVVLKDASSTALYGSRGASGVILITTKKGKKGDSGTVTFTSSYNNGVVNRLPTYQNEYAQGNLGNLTQANIGSIVTPGGGFVGSWGPRIAGQSIINSFGQPEKLQAYENNVKDIFQEAYSFQNNLSYTAGTEKSSFRIGLGNTEESYVLDNNKLIRTNLTFSGNTQVSDKFSVGTSFTYTNTTSRRTLQGNQLSNPLFRAYFTPRSYNLSGLPFEDATGAQTYFGGEDNPYWSIKNNGYSDKVNRLLGNFNAKYNFTKNVNLEFRIGSDFYNLQSKGFDEKGNRGGGFTGSGGTAVGGIIDNMTNVHNLNGYLTLNANKKIGDFSVTGTIGNEYVSTYRYDQTITGLGLVIPGFSNIKNALTYNPVAETNYTKLFGVFGDVVVEYKKFLSVNVKARNDWSSTLSPGNQSIFYPAASASFVLSEAIPVIKLDGKINLIKFRASTGEIGKGAPAYSLESYFVQASASDGFGPNIAFPYNGLAGFTQSNTSGNKNLTPEFTKEVTYGVDLAFFNNRLKFEGTTYIRSTRNVIISVPVSPAAGVTNVILNAGKLSTKGVEFVLSGTPLKTNNFSWDVAVNYTQFKSMVDELAPGVANVFLGGFTTPSIRLVAGDEYGQIYGTGYQRNAAGQLLISPTSGLPLPTTNVQKIGNPNPEYTMGITNSFNYKNFNLFFLLDIRKGGDQYSRNIADVQRNGVAIETAEFDRFNSNGTVSTPYLYDGVYAFGPLAGQANVTNVSAQSYYGNTGKYVAAEGFIYDTSWFRLRELSISYKLSTKILRGSFIKSFEIGAFGRNLFLHAPNYPHFDPEQNALGISNAQGLEFNSLPSTKTIGCNLRITL